MHCSCLSLVEGDFRIRWPPRAVSLGRPFVGILPGGGFTDPPVDHLAGRAFAIWGGYNAPIGDERDAIVHGGTSDRDSSTQIVRKVGMIDGVRLEMFEGTNAQGLHVNGLFSAALLDE